jgi:drug/metabolite transporter, DME family
VTSATTGSSAEPGSAAAEGLAPGPPAATSDVRSHALLLLLGATLFGTIGTARVLGPTSPSGSVGAVRVLLAAVVLVALAAWTRPARGAWSVECRRPSTLVAGATQAAFQLTFLAAVLHTGVAVGTLVAIGSAPLVAGLLSRHVSRAWVTATAVALSGLVLLVLGGGGARLSWAGLLLALGAGASYGVYMVATARAVTQGAPPALTTAVAFSVAAVVLLPWLVMEDAGWLGTASGWAMVVYLALVPTVLAYRLFARGLTQVPASTASTIALAEPVVAMVLGVVLLGERLSAVGWIGAGLVLTGLVLVARRPTATMEP